MQLLTEQTTTIGCTAAAAYEYATNLERFHEWFPAVTAVTSVNTLPHAQVGKEYLERVAVAGRGEQAIKILVKEARLNTFFATEGNFPPLWPRMEMAFVPVNAHSCHITWRMLSRNDRWWVRWTVLRLARRIMTQRAASAMVRLKQQLEGAAAG